MTIINGGNTDDTSEIQSAINSSGYVELKPRATYHVGSLNITNTGGVTIKGCGRLSSVLKPIKSGVNVIDLTGSTNITLEDFRIGGWPNNGIFPKTGILNAQTDGSYASDATHIKGVRVDGAFSLAAWYNLQVASSMVVGSHFYNYQASCPVVIHTGNNFFGATSDFTRINNANNNVPSDWSFLQCEIHSINAAAGFWMGGTQSYRYFGGNIASSVMPVDMNGVVVNGAVSNPSYTIFDGTTFYADQAPSPPLAIRQGAAFGVITRGCQASFPLV